MIGDEKKTCLKLLVAMAWADGRVGPEETEVVESVIDAFGASDEEAREIREWAKEPRTIDEIDVSGLCRSDKDLVLGQSVVLSFIDGEQSEKELALVSAMREKLGLSEEEAAPVLARAEAWARELLPILRA